MQYKDIYKLSNKFSPPKIDLRKAQILDDYGDESYAKLIVHHEKPDDVKREEFDYYGWVYPFMEPEDLIFYLYPMLIEYKKDKVIDCIDSFMYSMDREIGNLAPKLSNEEVEVLKIALKEIWNIGSNDDLNDWYQCENIQKFIGVNLS
jgi:hypothetical protein